jgi:hypothetical protein
MLCTSVSTSMATTIGRWPFISSRLRSRAFILLRTSAAFASASWTCAAPISHRKLAVSNSLIPIPAMRGQTVGILHSGFAP